MVIRTKRHRLLRYNDGERDVEEMGSEPVRVHRESEIITRRMSLGRMSTRSDIIVEISPSQRRQSSTNTAASSVKNDTDGMAPRGKNGRQSDVSPERGKLATVEIPGMETVTATEGNNTPVRSANGSISGTSVIHKPRRIHTRSKRSSSITSGSSSSDHEDMPTESISQLTTSLKLAQSRASSLSMNFARLMRLLRDDELERLDKQIAQVRNGSYEPLRAKYKEALEECDRKKQIAKARSIAAKTEINVRFSAMVESEWSQFNNDKMMLREKMCEEISSHISSLQAENDEARLLDVGVRPSSSLQQAPWWIKIPKRFTWLNLPDGVNDNQRDKDLARMGIITHHHHYPDPIGIRTPSPELAPRKRKKRYSDYDETKRPRYESYVPAEDYYPPDFDDRYPHLSGPPSAMPYGYPEAYDRGRAGSLTSLLHVVEDDMRVYFNPPPPPTPYWHTHPEPFNHLPYNYSSEPGFRAPLLPRPTMMPPDLFHPPHPIPHYPGLQHTATLPPLRLESSDGVARLTTQSPAPNPPPLNMDHQGPSLPTIAPQPAPDHAKFPPDFPHPIQSATIPIVERIESTPNIVPKLIAPRPGSAPPSQPPAQLPKPPRIKPSPSTKRTGSISPDLQRNKRPLTLLPKAFTFPLLQQDPVPPPSIPRRFPPPPPNSLLEEENRPANERYPLAKYNIAKGPVRAACAPPPPPSMGRFVHVEPVIQPGSLFPTNAKVAIPRNSGESSSVPQRIAPAPIKLSDSKAKSQTNVVVEIPKKSVPRSENMKDGEKVDKIDKDNGKDSGEIIEVGGRPGLRSTSLRRRYV